MSNFTSAFSSRFLLILALLALNVFLPYSSLSQNLPNEIRGYKVHREKVVVATGNTNHSNSNDAVIAPGEPKLVDVSVSGLTFELAPEIRAMTQSGTVDFITFHDFRVNGIPVEIEEYTESFPFRRNEPITLPKPARVFLPTHRLMQAAAKEFKKSRREWEVSGRVFVFGRFKKFGFSFKRVVPMDISLTIRNPIA